MLSLFSPLGALAAPLAEVSAQGVLMNEPCPENGQGNLTICVWSGLSVTHATRIRLLRLFSNSSFLHSGLRLPLLSNDNKGALQVSPPNERKQAQSRAGGNDKHEPSPH